MSLMVPWLNLRRILSIGSQTGHQQKWPKAVYPTGLRFSPPGVQKGQVCEDPVEENETKMAMNQEKTGYTFLQNYRKCDSTLQLHDQLFMKYGCIIPYSMEDSGPQDQLKKDMYSILATYVDRFSKDF
ncbi:Ral guanine nucleotide dissociation stimulator [Tupaia chinensis]|uniref:Ral guanine nucleotide dissociation stimulator n=1 Tax=Tupaia chinensis TaxID=246437 RepID=L9LB36_TUPCH|nr:Ral guanine nucleotide dissociation stimulator [Tupaia chinensis]